MASKFLSSQSIKTTRGFAAQAAVKAKPKSGETEPLTTTTLPNGVIVASIENNSPVTRVAIAYRAGSRNEPVEGIAHTLRVASDLSTKNSTGFGITRSLEAAGASLTCTGGREHTVYSVDATRNNIEAALPKLADAATQQAFKPWEVSDNAFRVKLDLAALGPQVQVVEMLHKAAFRSGLGNSLFCSAISAGKVSPGALQQFTADNFRADNAAVVGVGIPHDILVSYAQSLSLKAGSGKVAASKMHAGEVRQETAGDLAFVAVAAAGASLDNAKNLVTFALLQRALGTGAACKRGAGLGSLLTKSAAGAAGGEAFAVSALNINYSDAGLFGFIAAAPASVAGKVAGAATGVLRSTQLTSDQLSRSKAILKADILMSQESGAQILDQVIVGQLLTKVKNANLLSLVDSVTLDDVNAAAAALGSAKLAFAALGNLSSTPYADEL